MFLLNLKMRLGMFYHFFLEGKKSPNFNSLLNSATCWDKEGGVINQLSSLGRKIIVISFKKTTMIIISYMISKWLATTPSPSLFFSLTTEIDFERKGCGDFHRIQSRRSKSKPSHQRDCRSGSLGSVDNALLCADTLYPPPHVTQHVGELIDEGNKDGMILRLKSIQLSFTVPNSLNNFKEADMNIINEQNEHQVKNKSGRCFMSTARMMDLELQTRLSANLTVHSFPNGIVF